MQVNQLQKLEKKCYPLSEVYLEMDSMEGVEKKTPIDLALTEADGGHRTANGVNPMSTPTSCFTNANPMPIRKPPLTQEANGG